MSNTKSNFGVIGLTRRNGPSALILMREWYDKARLPIVYISIALMIFVLYLGAFLGSLRDFLLPAAFGVLIAFAVQSLQAIERQTESRSGDEIYSSVLAAVNALGLSVSLSRHKRRKRVQVKAIAATGWTTVSQILPKIMEIWKSARIELQIQVVDATGPLRDAYPLHWAGEIGQTLRECEELVKNNDRLDIRVTRCRYLPPIHGLLIDEHYLVIGNFGWTRPESGSIKLIGTDAPHHLYRHDDPAASQLFELFEGWFDNVPKEAVLPND